MTCNHAGSCSYLARTEGPIWRCEEFDDSGQAHPGPLLAVASRSGRPTAPLVRTERVTPLGLCVNCENRSHCGLPGAREGVWFCEEYR